MAFATGRGPRIYYELRGAEGAPKLVLIRGLGRGLDHWGEVVGELEQSFRLVLLDNRGIGRSEPSRVPFGVSHMAADVARVLDAARIDRAHVFGMSLGGMIAQRLAIEHRPRVDRLVLGCTTPGGPEALRPRLGTFAELAQSRLTSVQDAIEAEARLLLSDGFRRKRPDVVRRWVEIAEARPVSKRALLQQLAAAMRHRSDRDLHRITAPTLIVSADHDELIPPGNSRLLARRIRGAEIAWVNGARHDFATERPRELAKMLSAFLLDRR
jgi:pimeloyl-ACP methyl ester carboxylesterase